MAKISIKDLPGSIELDRKALAAIYGGARSERDASSLLQKTHRKAKVSLMDLARHKHHHKM